MTSGVMRAAPLQLRKVNTYLDTSMSAIVTMPVTLATSPITVVNSALVGYSCTPGSR
jgi:hypothetical protein